MITYPPPPPSLADPGAAHIQQQVAVTDAQYQGVGPCTGRRTVAGGRARRPATRAAHQSAGGAGAISRPRLPPYEYGALI